MTETTAIPELAELITTAVHTYMHGTPKHPDLGTHIAMTVHKQYRFTPRYKAPRHEPRKKAA